MSATELVLRSSSAAVTPSQQCLRRSSTTTKHSKIKGSSHHSAFCTSRPSSKSCQLCEELLTAPRGETSCFGAPSQPYMVKTFFSVFGQTQKHVCLSVLAPPPSPPQPPCVVQCFGDWSKTRVFFASSEALYWRRRGGKKKRKKALIPDIWGKRGATYGENGACRRG